MISMINTALIRHGRYDTLQPLNRILCVNLFSNHSMIHTPWLIRCSLQDVYVAIWCETRLVDVHSCNVHTGLRGRPRLRRPRRIRRSCLLMLPGACRYERTRRCRRSGGALHRPGRCLATRRPPPGRCWAGPRFRLAVLRFGDELRSHEFDSPWQRNFQFVYFSVR
jgi:hypothetical protein